MQGSESKLIVVKLTVVEAEAVHVCLTNGWGDGDARHLFGDGGKSLMRAWKKITVARRQHAAAETQAPKEKADGTD